MRRGLRRSTDFHFSGSTVLKASHAGKDVVCWSRSSVLKAMYLRWGAPLERAPQSCPYVTGRAAYLTSSGSACHVVGARLGYCGWPGARDSQQAHPANRQVKGSKTAMRSPRGWLQLKLVYGACFCRIVSTACCCSSGRASRCQSRNFCGRPFYPCSCLGGPARHRPTSYPALAQRGAVHREPASEP